MPAIAWSGPCPRLPGAGHARDCLERAMPATGCCVSTNIDRGHGPLLLWVANHGDRCLRECGGFGIAEPLSG